MSRRVLAVMLANGRQAMVERAIRSFASQTYEQRRLLVFDSGERGLPDLSTLANGVYYVHYEHSATKPPLSIGSLRNLANGLAAAGALECDLLAHWDSDDWSHRDRLTEQVAMLEATGADCVGYRDMLFYGARKSETWQFRSPNPAYILGTSMLYTRKIWERFPFQDRASAEDTLWLMEKRIKREATTSINTFDGALLTECPRMIAGLHGGNTCSVVKPGAVEWTRAERWDEFCRETMKL